MLVKPPIPLTMSSWMKYTSLRQDPVPQILQAFRQRIHWTNSSVYSGIVTPPMFSASHRVKDNLLHSLPHPFLMTKEVIRIGYTKFQEKPARKETARRVMADQMALLFHHWIYRISFWVTNFAGLHENFLRVLPRVCRTDRTQMPIAALSRLRLLFPFTVFLTLLIHEQSFLARTFFRVPIWKWLTKSCWW